MAKLINLFEFASRHKIRFTSKRGALSVEQLWDVPLRSLDGFDLDAVAAEASRVVRDLADGSFVKPGRTPAQEKAEVALEVVKHIIQVKLDAEEEEAEKAANREERANLLRILAEKQGEKLSDLTERELQSRIDSLKF